MQISRLFEMVYLLLNRKTVTAKELAERFEVSVRTVYRDVDTLAQAGIPIYTSRGKGGGISLMEDFILNKSLLSEEEQNQILMGLQSLSATGFLDEKNTLSKMNDLFQKQNWNWIEVDFSGWNNRKEEKILFHQIKKAILERRIVKFDYYNAKGEVSCRKAEPIQLLFKNTSWYLYGYCLEKSSFRLFKMNRMDHFVLTEELFYRKEIQKKYFDQETSFSSVSWITVKMIFAKEMAFRVFDEFPKECIEKKKDGSFFVCIEYPKDDWILSQILSFGGMVTVLEPEDIRNRVQKIAEEILKNYEIGKKTI